MLIELILATQLSLIPPAEITSDDQDLTEYLRFYSEDASRLTPTSAFEQLDQFEPLPNQSPNFGLHPEALWFALKLRGTDNHQKYVLAFSYPHLDSVQLTFFDQAGEILSQSEGGDLLPFKERYRPHRTLNFAVNFAQAAEQTLLIRIETQSSVQVGMRLQTLEFFDEVAAQENAGNFLYYGIFLVMIILNIFWFIMLRDSLYVPYIAYLIFYLCAQMSLNGTLFQFLTPNYPKLTNTLLLVSLSIALAYGTYFCAKFNELEHNSPRFSKVLTFIYWAALGTALISTFIPYRYAVPAVLLLGFTATLSALGSGIVGVQHKVRAAKFFLIAWVAFLVGCALFVLKTAGILPTIFLTEYAMQIGSALEVVLLTLALGDRVRSIIADRDALTQRVSRQTAILAQETQKRAQAEQSLRENLEERILLIDDASHHLNNPLNHISQANELISKAEAPIREHLRALLADAGNEAEEVRKFFESELNVIADSIGTIQEAVERSSLTVELLGYLAKENAASINAFDIAEMQNLVERRGVNLRIVDDRAQPHRLIGLPVLIVFALETLARNYLQDKHGLEIRVQVEEADTGKATLQFPESQLRDSHQMPKSIEAAKLLLKGFGTLSVSDDYSNLRVLFKEE